MCSDVTWYSLAVDAVHNSFSSYYTLLYYTISYLDKLCGAYSALV